MNTYRNLLWIPIVLWVAASVSGRAEIPTEAEALDAVNKAVRFFREAVSTEGGYLWQYSADLSRREGEGKADDRTVWVQPPGTPSVGLAYLDAYQMTGERFLLEAAVETAGALVRGQLESGGWEYRIVFDPVKRLEYAYREPPGRSDGKNTTTLDDDTTQAALRLLMRVDQALGFADDRIHEASLYGLESLIKAQYVNGAWPQRYSSPSDPDAFPVKQASYPATWSRTHPGTDYSAHCTFNDNTIGDVIATLCDAARIYSEPRYRAAAEKGGRFILLAQMPDPQPGWAQQYDEEMHPAWARKFEPPAITGGESQGVMRTLIHLYRETGNAAFLEPLPRALEYYRRSLRPDGRLARFYELQTNRPLYFTKTYEITYEDDDMPTHYSFVVTSRLDDIEAEYQKVLAERPRDATIQLGRKPKLTDRLSESARRILDDLDERGAWVESGRLRYHGDDDPTTRVIRCATFIRNLGVLSEFLAAVRTGDGEAQAAK